jgi:hypothetical protein
MPKKKFKSPKLAAKAAALRDMNKPEYIHLLTQGYEGRLYHISGKPYN